MPATVDAPPLLAEVQCALQQSPYVSPKQMRVEAFNGVVRLEGAVNTFFQKQMAQELLRRVKGVQQVDNQLQVTW